MHDSNDSKVKKTENVLIENIEETAEFKRLGVTAMEPSKAATARMLALILTLTFSTLLSFSFLMAWYVLRRSAQIDDKTLGASTEFLKAIGSIFTPLLAFVLGYYFSKRED